MTRELILKKINCLIFCSDVSPVKIFVAIASFLYAAVLLFGTVIDGLVGIFSHSLLAASFTLYGVGLLWRIFDTQHRKVSSLALNFFGSSLWIATAWQVIYEFLTINNHVHADNVAATITTAIGACWLLIRCGSGELYHDGSSCKC